MHILQSLSLYHTKRRLQSIYLSIYLSLIPHIYLSICLDLFFFLYQFLWNINAYNRNEFYDFNFVLSVKIFKISYR